MNAKTTIDFWVTENGECFCGDCARDEALDPDDLEEMTPDCAADTNRDIGDGFQLACSRCRRVVPATSPTPEWRARCLVCHAVQYFYLRQEGKHYCPRCRIPRQMERNPRTGVTA